MKYEQRGSTIVIRETGEVVECYSSNVMARRALRRLETEHMPTLVPGNIEPEIEPETKHQKPKTVRRRRRKKKEVPE